VLDAITALGSLREWLPAHWQYSWADALQPQLEVGGMIQGVSLSLSYGAILLALAFRGFARKDIVS
jgi:ABC-2 type transport system permease protein